MHFGVSSKSCSTLQNGIPDIKQQHETFSRLHRQQRDDLNRGSRPVVLTFRTTEKEYPKGVVPPTTHLPLSLQPAGSVPRSPTAAAGRPGGGAAARVDLVVLGPGSVFGEACLSGAPLDYSVAAASARVEVLVLHPADVRALGGSLVSAVAALADAKAAFRAAHHSLAVAAGQRQGDEAGRQLPAWLQKLPAHLLATAQDGGLPDPLPSPRLAPLTGAATFPGPSSPGAQTPRRAPRLQLEIPPASDPQTGGVPSPSPRANEAGSPLGGRPKLGFSLSWPPRPNSPPGSPNRAAAPSPVDSSLEAHMAQVMGASWGLRSSA